MAQITTTDANEFSSSAEFIPMRGFSNCHLQTMLPRLFRRQVKFTPYWQRLELPDGDFVDLAWSEDPAQAKHKPRLVVFHGLEGSLNSPYAHGLVEAAQKRGWLGVVMHFRGCSGEPNRMHRIYHSGETEDASWFLRWLQREFGHAPTAAVGYSLGDGHDLADFDTYLDPKIRGLTWPVVNGKPTTYRFNAEYDPYVKNGDFEFYGKLMKAIPQGNLDGITDKTPKPLPGRAKIFFRPFAEPVEKPDSNYDLMLCTGRILEHWHTGSMTRRVPELHRAAPSAVLYMHPTDAQKRGLKRNDVAQITSRRGSIKALVETQGRMKMPRGTVWMAFFDESVQVNKLCIDATDPISAEPDFKKSAVRVTKA